MSPITSYRLAHKLTLEQLGDRLGLNKSTVLRWERGHVPAERVLEIESKTGISRSDLRPDLFPKAEAS